MIAVRPSHLEFVRLPLFERSVKGLLSEEEIRSVENELLINPEAGAVEDQAGGVRKIRVAIGKRGKSGGGRVAYLHIAERQTVYFILAFPKNVQAALTAAQKKALRHLAAELKKER